MAARSSAAARAAPRRAAANETRPAARPARTRRPAKRPAAGLLGGIAWIAVLAVLLGGVVALNVAVLQLSIRLDHFAHERADLRAGNAALAAQLSSAAAPPHVVSVAHRKLGLVPAAPEETTYVQLPPGR